MKQKPSCESEVIAIMSAEIVYHYTTEEYFEAIMRSHLILPATAHIPVHERPIVWFSSNPKFERTALKGYQTSYGSRQLTVDEQREFAGCYRFGVPRDMLLPWPVLGKAARMTRRHIAALESAAVDQGADPSNWYGCFDPVNVYSVRAIVEELQADGTWSGPFGMSAWQLTPDTPEPATV